MVSLDVVLNVSFFSFTRHPFSFNHFEVEEADSFEDDESLVILEKVLSSEALLLLHHSRAKNVVSFCACFRALMMSCSSRQMPSLHFFPESGFEAPFTKTQRITLSGCSRRTNDDANEKTGEQQKVSAPTPPPNLLAPDSEEEEEEEAHDTTTGKTTRRNTTSNFGDPYRRGGGRHDGGSISTAVVLTLVCAFVGIGVFLQARTVAKIVKGSE